MNPILFGNDALTFGALPNVCNILFRKSAVPMIQSVIMSTFISCISIVFGFCSYFKMLWVYAWRVVAQVHNYLAIRYFANKMLIRKSMRSHLMFTTTKNSVSVTIFSSIPNPTSISFIDFCFKRFLHGYRRIQMQFVFCSSLVVMKAAQMTSNGFIAANAARDWFFNLVSHWHLLLNNSLCLIHGVCKCLSTAPARS